MKRHLLPLALALAVGIGIGRTIPSAQAASIAATQAAPDPAVQLRNAIDHLRHNDLVSLVQTMLPPAKYQMLQGAYEIKRNEPLSDDDREEFAEGFGRFTAPDAVDQLMAEIEPKLDKARPQAEGAILMALGAMQMAVASPESDLTDEQRAAIRLAMPGFERWVKGTDFLSSSRMRQALTLVTDAARQTGLGTLDDVQQLPLEQVLIRGGNVLAAVKQAVRLYGLDLDAIADSAYLEVVSIDGDHATVRGTVTVFDAPLTKEFDLVLVEGRWYGREMARDVFYRHDEDEHGSHVEIHFGDEADS